MSMVIVYVWNTPVNLSCPGLLFAGSFLITNSSDLFVQIVYFFQIHLKRLYISKNLSIYSRLYNLLK